MTRSGSTDGLTEAVDGLVPLGAGAVGFVLEQAGEAAEIAIFEGFADIAEMTAEVGEKVGEDAAFDAEAGKVDAEELGGLQDGFLGVLPVAEAAGELFHRGGGVAVVEELEGFSAQPVGFVELDLDLVQDTAGHLAGIGGFDEDGVAGEWMALEMGAVRLLAVDEDLHDQPVAAAEMGEDLPEVPQPQRINRQRLVIDGDWHRHSLPTLLAHSCKYRPIGEKYLIGCDKNGNSSRIGAAGRLGSTRQ
jgi:hypothetical protein